MNQASKPTDGYVPFWAMPINEGQETAQPKKRRKKQLSAIELESKRTRAMESGDRRKTRRNPYDWA